MSSYPVQYPTRKVPRLSPDEERELALRWRNTRDEAARDRILNAHLDLVRGVLGRLRGKDLPREDLFQDGVIGLIKAIDRFDPDEGVRFSTYASYWVRAEIQTSMGLDAGPVRIPRSHNANKVATWYHRVRARIESDIALGLCAPPDDGVEREAARRMGICPDKIFSLLGLAHSKGVPIRTQNSDGVEEDGGVLLFSDSTAETSLGERERQALFARAIWEACADLPERDREVIERRYLSEDPVTFQTIADGFGLTRERVRQIELRAFRSIRRKLATYKGIRHLVADGSD